MDKITSNYTIHVQCLYLKLQYETYPWYVWLAST
jgi:hypothetical protein